MTKLRNAALDCSYIGSGKARPKCFLFLVGPSLGKGRGQRELFKLLYLHHKPHRKPRIGGPVQPAIPSPQNANINFVPVSPLVDQKKRDTFSISQDRHYIGHDGFVVPINFAEFFDHYPQHVHWQVRCQWSICSEVEREDRENELLLYLMTIPEKSKCRSPGYNGLPDGCKDRIQIFDPNRCGGANLARFFYFINLMLRNHLTSIVQKASSDPIGRYDTLSLYSSAPDGTVIDEAYLSTLTSENSTVSMNYDQEIQSGIFMDEFFTFVRLYNPDLISVLNALPTTDTLGDAQKALGLTERMFGRARNRLAVLSLCFARGETPPRQRKVYRSRTQAPNTNLRNTPLPASGLNLPVPPYVINR